MGQVWQAFVGVRTRRVERYYQDLLATESDASGGKEHDKLLSVDNRMQHEGKGYELPEKWKKQIEKVNRCMGPGLYRSIFLIRRCCFFLGFIWDGLQECLINLSCTMDEVGFLMCETHCFLNFIRNDPPDDASILYLFCRYIYFC